MRTLQQICFVGMITLLVGCNAKKSDKIHVAFMNDPQVLGNWESVDFVAAQQDFTPIDKNWKGALYLKEMTFEPQGKMKQSWLSWSKGLLVHQGDHSVSRYSIKNVDGTDYLFLEWMSGDVVHRGMKPKYYVLKKSS